MMGPIGDVDLRPTDATLKVLSVHWNEYANVVFIKHGDTQIALSYEQARQVSEIIRFALPEWR